MQNVLASYVDNEILTAEPEKLVLLMYQGAIKFIRQARLAISEMRVEDAHNTILRAYAIVAELMATLDKERGGDIAANLERSYDFILNHLKQADVTKDDRILSEVENLLVPLADTWEQAFFGNGNRQNRMKAGPDSYKPIRSFQYATSSIGGSSSAVNDLELKAPLTGTYYGKTLAYNNTKTGNNGSGGNGNGKKPEELKKEQVVQDGSASTGSVKRASSLDIKG